MANERNDRISSFIDKDGVTQDKKFMLDVLNEIRDVLGVVSKTKLNLLGAGTLRDVTKSIDQLTSSYAKLNEAKQKAFQIDADETKRAYVLAAALEKQAEARKKNAEAEAKEIQNAQKRNANGVKNETNAFIELQKAVKNAWTEYTLLAAAKNKDIEATNKALTRYRELKIELDSINRNKTVTSTAGAGRPLQAELSAAKQLQKELAAAKDNLRSLTREGADTGDATREVARLQAEWDKVDDTVKKVVASVRALNGSSQEGRARKIQELEDHLESLRVDARAAREEMDRLATSGHKGGPADGWKEAAARVNDYQTKIELTTRVLQRLIQTQQQHQAIASGQGTNAQNLEEEATAASKLDSIYEGLREQLKLLQLEAQELASKNFLGLASQEELNRLGILEAQIDELNGGLNRIDTSIGRAQKNNLAYTQQLFSLQQILRETPSLAFGFSTYISAIANNLPIFIDDLDRIKQKNRELAATGQPVISTTQAIIQAFFNWQTLLLALVSILAIFSDDIIKWVGDLFRSEQQIKKNYRATQEYKGAVDALNQSIEKIGQAYQKLAAIQARTADLGLNKIRGQIDHMKNLGYATEKYIGLRIKLAEIEKNNTGIGAIRGSQGIASTFIAQANSRRNPIEDEISQKRGIISKLNSSDGVFTDELKNVEGRTYKEKKENLLKITQLELDNLYQEKTMMAERLKLAKQYSEGVIREEEFLQKTLALTNDQLVDQTAKLTNAQYRYTGVVQNLMNAGKDPKKSSFANGLLFNAEQAEKDKVLLETAAQTAADEIEKINQGRADHQAELDEQNRISHENAEKAKLAASMATADQMRIIAQDTLADETKHLEARKAAVRQIAEADRIAARAQLAAVRGDRGATAGDRAAAEKAFATEMLRIKKQTNRDLLTLDYEYEVRRGEAIKEGRNMELSLQNRFNEDLMHNDEVSLDARMALYKEWYKVREQQIRDDYQQQLRVAGVTEAQLNAFIKGGMKQLPESSRATSEELEKIFIEYNTNIADLIREGAQTATDIWKSALEKQKELHEDFVSDLEIIYQQDKLGSVINYSKEYQDLNESLKKKKISIFTYIHDRDQQERKFHEESLKRDREQLRSKIAGMSERFGDPFEQLAQSQEKLQALRGQLKDSIEKGDKQATENLLGEIDKAEQLVEMYRKLAEEYGKLKTELEEGINTESQEALTESLEKQAQLFDNVAQLGAKILDVLSQVTMARFQERADAIQKEMDLLDLRAQKERELAEQAGLTEEQKAKRLGEIESKREALRAQLEMRRKANERARARAEKQFAVMQVGVELARTIAQLIFAAAIANAIPGLGTAKSAQILATIPFVVAGAAAQIATISAAKIPEYATGTRDSGKAGLAWLGDGGKRELVMEPSGHTWITGDKPELNYLPAHSVVYPDAEQVLNSTLMMAHGRAQAGAKGEAFIDSDSKAMIDTLNKGFNKVSKTIADKPEVTIKTSGNVEKLMKYGNYYYRHL